MKSVCALEKPIYLYISADSLLGKTPLFNKHNLKKQYAVQIIKIIIFFRYYFFEAARGIYSTQSAPCILKQKNFAYIFMKSIRPQISKGLFLAGIPLECNPCHRLVSWR